MTDMSEDWFELFSSVVEPPNVDGSTILKEYMINRLSFILSREDFISNDSVSKDMLIKELNKISLLTISFILENHYTEEIISDYSNILNTIITIQSSVDKVILKNCTQEILELVIGIENKIIGEIKCGHG